VFQGKITSLMSGDPNGIIPAKAGLYQSGFRWSDCAHAQGSRIRRGAIRVGLPSPLATLTGFESMSCTQSITRLGDPAISRFFQK
jgi:hypothetical protein